MDIWFLKTSSFKTQIWSCYLWALPSLQAFPLLVNLTSQLDRKAPFNRAPQGPPVEFLLFHVTSALSAPCTSPAGLVTGVHTCPASCESPPHHGRSSSKVLGPEGHCWAKAHSPAPSVLGCEGRQLFCLVRFSVLHFSGWLRLEPRYLTCDQRASKVYSLWSWLAMQHAGPILGTLIRSSGGGHRSGF